MARNTVTFRFGVGLRVSKATITEIGGSYSRKHRTVVPSALRLDSKRRHLQKLQYLKVGGQWSKDGLSFRRERHSQQVATFFVALPTKYKVKF